MGDDLQPAARAITWRSSLFGLVGGTLICVALPYNDWVLNNTPLVGNNLPLAVMFLMLLFAVCVNGPLSRRQSRQAWAGGELAVAFTLMLVMCAIPSSGLMRYLPPNIVMPFVLGVDNAGYRKVFEQLGVASWVFPSFESTRPSEWGNDPLATGFAERWLNAERSPYGAWVRPFIAWGLLTAALAWALLCMATIVMRQWRDNEFLPFPLTTIQLALLEPPARGRWFNRVLGARSFWIAFAAVFFLHANNGLATYFPKNVVPISRGFDLMDILKDAPWSYSEPTLRKATLYFSIIGVAYFLSGPVGLSLWFFLVWIQVWKMILGSTGAETGLPGIGDQRHGVALAIFCSLLWLGRRHWRLVIAQGFRGERAGEPTGTYLSYRTAFWGMVGGCVVMILWLVAAGASVIGAINIVVVLMISFFLITRIIAETGLIHGAMPISNVRPFDLAYLYLGAKVPIDTYYLGSTLHGIHYDYREVIPVYATHGLNAVDHTTSERHRTRAFGRRLITLICVGLALAYATSFWTSLVVQYQHSVTMDLTQTSPIDKWGALDNPRWQVIEPTMLYEKENFPDTHSRLGHVAWGFGVTAALSVLRLTISWWPLHPVGYLLYGTFPSVTFWFSIFLGWLAKRVVLRFGTATFYEQCKPFFIGLILGETAAAGAWAIVSVLLNALGVPYRSYLVLPM